METGFTRLLAADQSRGRVYVEPGWLPPADECSELAGLRDEHNRLLGVVEAKLSALSALRRDAEAAKDQRADALREAILAGHDDASAEDSGPSEGEIARAQGDYVAAADALEIWVGRTLVEIEEKAPEIEAGITTRLRTAEEKRTKAMRLLEEAARLSAEPQRLRNWLARYVTVTDEFSGERRKASVLGPIAFDALAVPHKEPVPSVFYEIAGIGPAEVVEVGSDELDPSEKEAMLHA